MKKKLASLYRNVKVALDIQMEKSNGEEKNYMLKGREPEAVLDANTAKMVLEVWDDRSSAVLFYMLHLVKALSMKTEFLVISLFWFSLNICGKRALLKYYFLCNLLIKILGPSKG